MPPINAIAIFAPENRKKEWKSWKSSPFLPLAQRMCGVGLGRGRRTVSAEKYRRKRWWHFEEFALAGEGGAHLRCVVLVVEREKLTFGNGNT